MQQIKQLIMIYNQMSTSFGNWAAYQFLNEYYVDNNSQLIIKVLNSHTKTFDSLLKLKQEIGAESFNPIIYELTSCMKTYYSDDKNELPHILLLNDTVKACVDIYEIDDIKKTLRSQFDKTNNCGQFNIVMNEIIDIIDDPISISNYNPEIFDTNNYAQMINEYLIPVLTCYYQYELGVLSDYFV